MQQKVFSTGTLLLFIAILALTLRFINLYQLEQHGYFTIPEMAPDSQYNHVMAQRIADGDLLAGDDAYYSAPLYPYVLALFYSLLAPAPLYPKIAQALIGGLSPLLIFWLGRRLFSERTGLLAALIAGLYPPFIFYDALLLKTSLATFLALAALCFLVMALERKRGVYWLLSGGVIGAGALARPNMLLFVPLAVLGIIWIQRRGGFRTAGRRAALFVLGALLVISPVSLRNLYRGDTVLMSSNGGFSFYVGNNALARPLFTKQSGISATMVGEEADTKRLAEEATGRRLRPSEVSSFWFRKGLGFVFDDFPTFVHLVLGKLFFAANQLEIPNNENYYFARQFSALLRLPLPSFAVIMALALVGASVGRRRGSGQIFLDLFILSTFFSLVFFYVIARFRLPMIPFLILYAAHALCWSFDRFRAKAYRPVALAAASAGILTIFTSLDLYPRIKQDFSQCYQNAGIAYRNLGQPQRAIQELLRGLEGSRQKGVLYELIGVSYGDLGEEEKSLAYLNRALAAGTPQPARALLARGLLFFKAGDLMKAEKDLLRGIELQPHLARAQGFMGVIRRKQGRIDEAIEYLRRARGLQPEWPMAYLELGLCYRLTGETRKAVAILEERLKHDPADLNILALLRELKG